MGYDHLVRMAWLIFSGKITDWMLAAGVVKYSRLICFSVGFSRSSHTCRQRMVYNCAAVRMKSTG